jgi:hypothetical protein
MKELIEGIGTTIGGAIALSIIALKQFSLWPFNRRRKVPTPGTGASKGEMDESFSKNGTTRRRRRHARAWNPADYFLAIEQY